MSVGEAVDTKTVTEQALTWPAQARALQIVDQSSYMQAAEMLKGIKALRKEINATFDPIIGKAFEAHKMAVAQKKNAETPLVEAENILKRSVVSFEAEQERIRREAERRAREEAARMERERQEQIRRAEEEARQRAEEEKLAAAVEAEAEGAPAEDVEAILDAPVHVAPVVVFTPPIVTPVVPQTFERAAGVSKPRENWSAVVDDPLALIRYVAEHPDCIEFLTPNMPALNAQARSKKLGMSIPGVRAVNNPSINVGGR